MVGCTICELAFTMVMELIIQASQWMVEGKYLQTHQILQYSCCQRLAHQRMVPYQRANTNSPGEARQKPRTMVQRRTQRQQLELMQNTISGPTALPGRLKFGAFYSNCCPDLWPITIYKVTLSHANQLKRLANSQVRKWLGLTEMPQQHRALREHSPLAANPQPGGGIQMCPSKAEHDTHICINLHLVILTQAKLELKNSWCDQIKRHRK